MTKEPLDKTAYPQDPRSKPIDAQLPDGLYVYVQDVGGVIYVLPDGPHMHPRVLGGARHAMYAGDMTIDDGEVRDLTNLSGTFLFDSPVGLLEVARLIEDDIGISIQPGAIRLFHLDGRRPQVLR